MADQLAKAEGQKASPSSTDTKKADGKPPSDKLEEMIKKAADAPTTEDKKLSEALKAAVEKKVEGSREEDSESDSAADAAKSDEDATESLKNALSQAKLVSEAIRQAAAQNKDEPTLDLADEERGLGLSSEGPTDESGSKKDVTKPKARQLETKVSEVNDPAMAPPMMNGQPIKIESTTSQTSKRDATNAGRQLEMKVSEVNEGAAPTFNGQPIHVESKSTQVNAGKRDEQLSANVKVDMKASDSGIKVSDTPDDRSAPTAVQATGRQNVPCNLSPCNMPALHLSVVNDRKPCDPVVTSNVDIKCMGDGRTPVVKEEYARKKSDVNHLVVVHDENADRRQAIVKPSTADAEEVL